MLVTVHHQIRDPKLWTETSRSVMTDMEQGRLPEGLKGLMYLPSRDGQKADCLWEADQLEHLKSFLDGRTGKVARNEYFEVDDSAAVGVPAHDQGMTSEAEGMEAVMHLRM